MNAKANGQEIRASSVILLLSTDDNQSSQRFSLLLHTASRCRLGLSGSLHVAHLPIDGWLRHALPLSTSQNGAKRSGLSIYAASVATGYRRLLMVVHGLSDLRISDNELLLTLLLSAVIENNLNKCPRDPIRSQSSFYL